MEKGNDYRVGNYVLRKVEEDGLSMVEVRAAGGHWRAAWAETTSIYHLLDGTDFDDPDDLEGIGYFLTAVYAASMIADVDFLKSVYEGVERMRKAHESDPGVS